MNDGIVIGQLIVNNASDENFDIYPNIDKKYGPYSSLEEALEAIPKRLRAVGLTFAVKYDCDEIVEYWFNGGIEDTDIEKKLNSAMIIIQ